VLDLPVGGVVVTGDTDEVQARARAAGAAECVAGPGTTNVGVYDERLRAEERGWIAAGRGVGRRRFRPGRGVRRISGQVRGNILALGMQDVSWKDCEARWTSGRTSKNHIWMPDVLQYMAYTPPPAAAKLAPTELDEGSLMPQPWLPVNCHPIVSVSDSEKRVKVPHIEVVVAVGEEICAAVRERGVFAERTALTCVE
jgi:hypothetical protein